MSTAVKTDKQNELQAQTTQLRRPHAQPTILAVTPTPSTLVSNTQAELYSRLILLSLLSKYKDRPTERDAAGEKQSELIKYRRDFLDRLSYLCDIDKFGSTVTAAALQKVPAFNILWLAANESFHPGVEEFVHRIIHHVKSVTPESRHDVEDTMLEDAVKMGMPRLRFYRDKMVDAAIKCRDDLKQYMPDDQALKLRAWLRKMKKLGMKHLGSKKVVLMIELIKRCEKESDVYMPYLRERDVSFPGNETNGNCYADMKHFVARLRAHVYSVKDVVKASLLTPSLRKIGEIKVEPSSEPRNAILPDRYLNPYRTFTRCLAEEIAPMRISVLLKSVTEREASLDFDSASRKHSQITNTNTFITRVHAEILLADLFSRRNFDFVDDDKYIGCSKPACYCCARYFESHPKTKFVRPATHNKILLGWRCPEPNQDLDIRGRGKKTIEQIERTMNWTVRQHLMEKLEEGGEPIEFHWQSTNGSVRDLSILSGRVIPFRGR
ncbi:hypothetical protein NA57DRAFT_61115 [Rhizodiscina lignyota]|uniref:Uncharacterized protein n=1 Tax=Rhizodiscina lignyota TaxID=1504668 RepID=A0A9P4I4X5_9PEZI|nr:hypothetical protein NA57DRAFT_61115 [Rhizodiscina lignyota]